MNIGRLGIVAVVTSLLVVAVPAFAKHDSNTLHKIGHAIQYPINKTSQNVSVTTHRAINHKSVMHRRNGNRTYRAVITPAGHVYRKHRVVRHHHIVRHHVVHHYHH